jgi:uncharacterized protein YndB with AHSA1/START domain
MKVLKGVGIVVAGLVVLFFAVGFLLPSKYNVTRAVLVNAPAQKVYSLVATPKQWANWSVWNRRDPGMKVRYSGPESGQGAKWAWESKTEGAGNMEFTTAEPNKRVEFVLSFPEFGSKSMGAFTLLPEGDGTHVTWTMVGDVGANPAKHYFAALMDRMVGPDFEGGLVNLKALAEKP